MEKDTSYPLEDLKQEIVDKSTYWFTKRGFKSVTMDFLAQEMKISKKTVYSFFKSKKALVEASLRKLQQVIHQEMTLIREQNLDAIAEMMAIKYCVKLSLNSDENTGLFYELRTYYGEIFHKLHSEEIHLMRDCLQSNLKQGIQEGVYRPDLDIGIVTEFYAVLNFSNMAKSNSDFYKMELHILEYHFRAICTEQGLQKFFKLKTQYE